MLTLNADVHPLMTRMHKPDPQFGPDQQDKRSVVPIELKDMDEWLLGTRRTRARWCGSRRHKAFDAGPVADEGLHAD